MAEGVKASLSVVIAHAAAARSAKGQMWGGGVKHGVVYAATTESQASGYQFLSRLVL